MKDVDVVKNHLNGSWNSIITPYLPPSSRLDARHGPCPLCGGKDRFRFDDKDGSGSWICNQCGSGDGIELYKRLTKTTFPEAIKRLANLSNLPKDPARKEMQPAPEEIKPTVPAPEPGPTDLHHKALGAPVATWRYTTAKGELIAIVARYDGPEKKVFTPWIHTAGKWACHAHPAPRPLYNLPTLKAKPRLPVIFVEGEKTADAAQRLFPQAVATTGMNGSSFFASHDLTPLMNRVVILVPDADKPGLKYMEKMAERLNGVAASVQVIRLPETLEITDSGGWDLADGGPHLEEVSRSIKQAMGGAKANKPALYLPGDLSERAQAIYDALGLESGLYVWGSVLVRLIEVRGQKQMQIMDPQRLHAYLTTRFTFFIKNASGEWSPKTLPLQICTHIMSLPTEELPFPPIERILRSPVYGTDKTLAVTTGYHESAQAWLELGDLQLDVPAIPNRHDLEWALETLDDALADFPFQDEISYANTLSLLLLPFVRMLIDGSTPFHFITAPVQGSGKSLLAELIAFVTTGQPATILTEAGDDAAWKKMITAVLMQSPAIVVVDNINRKVDSAALVSTLTSPSFDDRKLGATEILKIRNEAVWIGTANNPTMTGEMARRVCWIQLNPTTETPWKRTGFRHNPLMPWVKQNRMTILQACLILIQNWIAQGAVPGDYVLGSFEDWARTMSGILRDAGITGFMANADQLYDVANEESVEWREFVDKWYAKHKKEPVRAIILMELVKENGYFEEHLGDGTDRSRLTKFGLLLKKNADRVFGEHRIIKKRTFMNGAIFTLGAV